MSDWYVVHVRTDKEEETARVLEKIPKLKVKVLMEEVVERRKGSLWQRLKLIFPGYIFINVIIDTDMYYRINKVPGVIRILDMKKGSNTLIPLTDKEVKTFLKVSNDTGLLKRSKATFENGKIKILEGPLLGYEDNIVKVDKRKCKAKVKIKLMGEVYFKYFSFEIVKAS